MRDEAPAHARTLARAVAPREAPRVLIIAESLPYPTVKGGDLRNWQNVNALASCSRVGVFGLCSNDRRRDAVPGLPIAFWTASTDPALTIPPPSGVRLSARAWLLDPVGHPSDLFYSEHAAGELSRLTTEFRPDIVIVEGVWLHRYLDTIRRSACRTILDCHNIEAQVALELAAVTKGDHLEARVRRNVIPARTEVIERRAVSGVDEIWVCSRQDEELLRRFYQPAAPVAVIPNGIRLADYEQVRDARQTSRADAPLTLVFPGFFGHLPNERAAMFLIEEIFPRLARKWEDSRLILVGANPPQNLVASAKTDERITVTGAVRDIKPWLARAAVVPVPLFEGGGTRLKIVEAFAAGVPVISTPKGAEGLGVRHGEQLLVAETADEFVDAALSIHNDRASSARLVAAAQAFVAAKFSWDVVSADIRDAIMGAHT